VANQIATKLRTSELASLSIWPESERRARLFVIKPPKNYNNIIPAVMRRAIVSPFCFLLCRGHGDDGRGDGGDHGGRENDGGGDDA
jgi:hypothetical protein